MSERAENRAAMERVALRIYKDQQRAGRHTTFETAQRQAADVASLEDKRKASGETVNRNKREMSGAKQANERAEYSAWRKKKGLAP